MFALQRFYRLAFAFVFSGVIGVAVFPSLLEVVFAEEPPNEVERRRPSLGKIASRLGCENIPRRPRSCGNLEKMERKSPRNERLNWFPIPVFRYSDEERFIPDATLWVWTRDARPIAFQKVEGNNYGGGQAWTICFASLSKDLISVKWSNGRKYLSRTPGVEFKALFPTSRLPRTALAAEPLNSRQSKTVSAGDSTSPTRKKTGLKRANDAKADF